ncbi:hypothetical protein FRC18_004765 [Serendipita sp. 400]|nr:hypothetical protein FRC18_004765 [Serendipita sp. 400]
MSTDIDNNNDNCNINPSLNNLNLNHRVTWTSNRIFKGIISSGIQAPPSPYRGLPFLSLYLFLIHHTCITTRITLQQMYPLRVLLLVTCVLKVARQLRVATHLIRHSVLLMAHKLFNTLTLRVTSLLTQWHEVHLPLALNRISGCNLHITLISGTQTNGRSTHQLPIMVALVFRWANSNRTSHQLPTSSHRHSWDNSLNLLRLVVDLDLDQRRVVRYASRLSISLMSLLTPLVIQGSLPGAQLLRSSTCCAGLLVPASLSEAFSLHHQGGDAGY